MLRYLRTLLAIGLALSAGSAVAELEATVDRNTVRQNESFSYVLRLSGDDDGEPNFQVFENCCEILNRNHSTRVQIMNGDYQRVNEWRLSMMARSTGPITLPSVRVGNRVSNPITMMVLSAPDGGAAGDVFLEVVSDPQHPYVQAEAVYTLRLYIGVDIRGQRLSEPVVTGGEAIIEKLGDDRRFQADRGGRTYTVIERRYSIFPQNTGNLTVEPLVFEAQVVAAGTFSRIQRYQSDAIELMVKPVEAPPPSHPDAVWLPARQLSLQDEWSGDTASAGIPMTRQLTIRADGLLNTQVPAVMLGDADGVRQYSDQPELTNWVTDTGMQGRRTENIAVIAGNAGEFTLPALELPWFDVDQGEWQIARVPPKRLSVSPSREQQTANADLPAAALEPLAEARPGEPRIWRWATAVFGIGWLLTALGWGLWGKRSSAKPVVMTTEPSPRAQQRRVLKALRRACEENQAQQASELLQKWAQVRFESQPPRSLAALADRMGPELKAAIDELEQQLYGPVERDWQGGALLAALKQVDAVNQRDHQIDADDALLPLYR